jgi:hypothetical protein
VVLSRFNPLGFSIATPEGILAHARAGRHWIWGTAAVFYGVEKLSQVSTPQYYYNDSYGVALDFLKNVPYMFQRNLECVGYGSVAIPQAHTGKGASLRVPARGRIADDQFPVRLRKDGLRQRLCAKQAVVVEANVFAAVREGPAVFGE